jgi:hypothetical protein
MSVVDVRIQTVEDMYRLIWTATTDQHHLQRTLSAVLSSSIVPQSRWASVVCSVINTAGTARAVGAIGFTGKLTLRRFRETAAG